MKNKFLKAVSIMQAVILIVGMFAFATPLKVGAASLGITPSTQFQNSAYYQLACNAYSSNTDPRTRMVQIALSQAAIREEYIRVTGQETAQAADILNMVVLWVQTA